MQAEAVRLDGVDDRDAVAINAAPHLVVEDDQRDVVARPDDRVAMGADNSVAGRNNSRAIVGIDALTATDLDDGSPGHLLEVPTATLQQVLGHVRRVVAPATASDKQRRGRDGQYSKQDALHSCPPLGHRREVRAPGGAKTASTPRDISYYNTKIIYSQYLVQVGDGAEGFNAGG